MKVGVSLHLRKLPGKSVNNLFKVPTRTDLLTKNLGTSKLLFNSPFTWKYYKNRHKKIYI